MYLFSNHGQIMEPKIYRVDIKNTRQAWLGKLNILLLLRVQYITIVFNSPKRSVKYLFKFLLIYNNVCSNRLTDLFNIMQDKYKINI